MGFRFADFIPFFLNITETKLFHFNRIFEKGGGGFIRIPSESTTGFQYFIPFFENCECRPRSADL